jgi:CubicO group peptidase (beta-lactamase class C family)
MRLTSFYQGCQRRLVLAIPMLLLNSAAFAAGADHFLDTDLPSFIDQVRTAFNVPGIAVALVRDGKVVFAKGSGVRDLRNPQPVDADTMFCIASITKSVTATAIEMLADDGKLKLDDHVIDHLRWFQMSDPYVTREMRIRDLLAHRSGLGSHEGDLLFMPGTTYSTRQVVERMRDLPLRTGFRSEFAYENVMFAVATLIIEQASGESYAEFIQRRIFAPLKMTQSRVDGSYLKPGDNFASAYMPQADGSLLEVPVLVWKNDQGAGGIYASVRDMSQWTLMQLRSADVPQLISEKNQRDMWSMVTPIPVTPDPDPVLHAADPNFQGYASGWYVSDYRRQRMVWHTGGFPGTGSLLTLLPEQHLGIVVLTNQESENAYYAIMLRVLDHYLNFPPSDWLGALSKVSSQAEAALAQASAKQAAERQPDAQVPRSLESYVGTYHDAWYGDIEVRAEGGGLRLRFVKSARLTGLLSIWHDDTFLVKWDDRTLNADALISFTLDSQGRVSGASMRRASPRVARAYDFQDLHLVRTNAH